MLLMAHDKTEDELKFNNPMGHIWDLQDDFEPVRLAFMQLMTWIFFVQPKVEPDRFVNEQIPYRKKYIATLTIP